MLTACTSSENEDMISAGAGTSVSADSQTVEGQASNSQGSGSGDTALVGVTDGQQSTSQNVSGTTDSSAGGTGAASGTSSDGTTSTGGQGSTTSSGQTVSGEFDGIYQAGADETEALAGDIWSGTYTDGEETVKITYIDKETISFAFSQAGISGKASVDGAQAVYNGDDHHVVVFDIQGDTVVVDVASEEDYDTSGSPLIGTYTKEQENPST